MKDRLVEQTTTCRYPVIYEPFVKTTVKAVCEASGVEVSAATVMGMALEALQERLKA